MMKRKTWIPKFLFGLYALTSIGLVFALNNQAKAQEPEKLLPANSIIYFQYDGSVKHKKAFEQTAAYESFHKSGLVDVFNNVFTVLIQEASKVSARSIDREEGGNKGKEKIEQNLKDAKALFTTVLKQGASLSISLPEGQNGPPLPFVTLVVKGVGKYEPKLRKGLSDLFEQEGVKFKTETIKGRKVSKFLIPETPGIEAGWWVEGEHLVIVVGMNALKKALDVAAGDAPNITTHRLYKKYVLKKVNFSRDSIGWVNLGALRKTFGEFPLPMPSQKNRVKTINDLLTTLGLHNLGAIVSQSGYKGKSIWTESTVETFGKRTGILKMSATKTFKLADLPPLPEKVSTFSVASIDYSKFYKEGFQLALDMTSYMPPRDAKEAKKMVNTFPDVIGFDPQKELFDHLGSITCIYSDPSQEFFGIGGGFGMAIAIEVKNPQKLKTGLNTILDKIKKLDKRNQVSISRSVKQGREVVHVYAKKVPFGPAFCVDDKWLVIGLVPQTVEAFLLRLDGKLNRWKPSEEHQKALAELPKEYTSLTMSDPRQIYQLIFSVAPVYSGVIEMFLRQEMRYEGMFPLKTSDFPPAEVVVKPMFANFSVVTVDEEGFHAISRSSVPSIEVGPVAIVGIAAAIAIPAIEQSRRSQYERPSRFYGNEKKRIVEKRGPWEKEDYGKKRIINTNHK